MAARLGVVTPAALALLAAANAASAGPPRIDAASPAEAAKPQAVRVTPDAIRSAVVRSVALIESSGAEYRRRRECFSCHHQALPVLTLVEARRRGFSVDEENLAAQLDRTAEHLKRGRDGYHEGRGQGGQADTAGWALWTLEEGGRGPDETTAAVAHYLLTWQRDLGHWDPPGGDRPPTQGSAFTTTYVSARGLEAFGTPEQAEGIAARREEALAWLRTAPARDTEDKVFRLRSLHYLGADDAAIRAAADELLGGQRSDGGWAQTEDRPADAYATGTALVALHDAGLLTADDPAYLRGLAFLLRAQAADGSWRVQTRAKPIQVYFESGFPYGRDQFLSMAATCWATTALLRACPEAE